jgi:lipoic acid synthetase
VIHTAHDTHYKGRLPNWLKVRIPTGKQYYIIHRLLHKYRINTVCDEAACPNRGECFNHSAVTFLIMGNRCTRNCRYCHIKKAKPLPLDKAEAGNIASIVDELGLQHVVITSVTRDDLEDCGAAHFASVVRAVRELSRDVVIEVLIPDFNGNHQSIESIIKAGPHIIGHNLEIVQRLFSDIRPHGDYTMSLNLLRHIKYVNPAVFTKSGIMVGMGEREGDIAAALEGMMESGVDMVTIGQYLPPTKKHYPVKRYYHPSEFAELEQKAYVFGFKAVAAAPLVRSSYHAGDLFNACKNNSNEFP